MIDPDHGNVVGLFRSPPGQQPVDEQVAPFHSTGFQVQGGLHAFAGLIPVVELRVSLGFQAESIGFREAAILGEMVQGRKQERVPGGMVRGGGIQAFGELEARFGQRI